MKSYTSHNGSYYLEVEISALVGKTFSTIAVNGANDEIVFLSEDGSQHYAMFHSQNCCEQVVIEDIVGDLEDLRGSPILQAEEVSYSEETPPEFVGTDKDKSKETVYGSYTWTFYKLATIKGSVTLRWLGESNGYYSESVSILDLNQKEDE